MYVDRRNDPDTCDGKVLVCVIRACACMHACTGAHYHDFDATFCFEVGYNISRCETVALKYAAISKVFVAGYFMPL